MSNTEFENIDLTFIIYKFNMLYKYNLYALYY